jgi:CO/xanthine dehydrogenase FAD-binding subunit
VRGHPEGFELVSPATLADALALLSREPGVWRPLAGGTDVMVLFSAGRLPYPKLLNLWPLRELRGIDVDASHVTLGALTTYTDIERNAVLQREYPMLCQAASETGGVAIQNRGTLGGNVVNASPAADSPPALLAYGAELELVSHQGTRTVAYDGFHTGYKRYDLRPDELLARVRLPRVHGGRAVDYYRKVGPRRAQAISKVCFAGHAVRGADGALREVRIALGGVAPVVLRCKATEAVLRERGPQGEGLAAAHAALAREIAPIDDVRSTARYRRRVAGNLLDEFARALRADVELGR